jgi:hypothetical protein
MPLDRDVQCGSRFIGDDELGPASKSNRNEDALTSFNPRALLKAVTQHALGVTQPHLTQQFHGAPPGLGA